MAASSTTFAVGDVFGLAGFEDVDGVLGYDPGRRILTIYFGDGSVYAYENVARVPLNSCFTLLRLICSSTRRFMANILLS
jgi:hypothetical protein